MTNGKLRTAVERSISAAEDSGTLDREMSAAPIEMLLYMADYLDKDNGKTPATRYVTPASFLSYCEALGLTPPEVIKTKGKKKDGKTTTERMRGKFRNYDGKAS